MQKPKKYTVYLIVGIALSLSSKIIQFTSGHFLGELLILLAAIFFVLTLLQTLPGYQLLVQRRRGTARIVAFSCCGAVLSFQLLLIALVGRGYSWGGDWNSATLRFQLCPLSFCLSTE